MNAEPLSWRRNAPGLVAVLTRWLLGILFLYMGLNKALHPVEFLKLVRQYELVQDPLLLNSIAAALPWFEVFCGLLLVAGVGVRGSALMLVLMLLRILHITATTTERRVRLSLRVRRIGIRMTR